MDIAEAKAQARRDAFARRREARLALGPAPEAATEAALQALEARPDAELLAEAGLKEPEALVSAEEIRAFLKHALPDRLKRRALRRLWGLNPVLANVDGLVDYGEDFTDAAMVVENMQTLYQVGKGMFDKAVEQAEAEARAANIDEDAIDEAPDQVRGEVAEVADDSAEPPAPASEPGLLAIAEPPPEQEPQAAAPRRMRFRFETST